MSPARPVIVVVGDVALDIVAKLEGPVVFGHDTRAKVSVRPGGAGGNTAAWLARLGGHAVRVALVGRIGADEAGRHATSGLRALGVDCRFTVDPRLPTCSVLVLVAPDGERTMVADRGANGAFAPGDVALPDAAHGHVHVSAYVLLDSGSRPAGLRALRLARERGWTTSVDPQAATHIESVGGRTFLEWISGVDLLLPNEAELAALGGLDAALTAVRAVAVTHGRAGGSWLSATERITEPTPLAHDTDSTGAGDAFNAGLLSAWLTGATPAEALRAGVAAGTAAAGQIGAQPQD